MAAGASPISFVPGRAVSARTLPEIGARMTLRARRSSAAASAVAACSIWALAARVLGLPWPRYRSLGLPTNTSLTRVQLTSLGMRLVDYNLPLR